MAKKGKMLFVVDGSGRIIAAAHPGAPARKEDKGRPSIGIRALDGQRVIAADVPAEITKLVGHDLHRVLSSIRVEPNSSKVTFGKIDIRKAKH